MMTDYIHSLAAVPGEEILSAIAEDWWKKVLTRQFACYMGCLEIEVIPIRLVNYLR